MYLVLAAASALLKKITALYLQFRGLLLESDPSFFALALGQHFYAHNSCEGK